MAGLKSLLLEQLEIRKDTGIRQNELYSKLKFSRSHISETLGALEREGAVIRRKEGKSAKRIWLADYFPEHIEGVLRVGMLRSSEYIPFLSALKKEMSEEYKLVVKVYDDAIDVISSLHSGILEIALAPTFTHVLFSITSGKEIITSTLSYGGSSLLMNRKSNSNILATSESSTMALMSRELVRDGKAVVQFFDNPDRVVEKFLTGEVKYMAIWEPYLSYLRTHEEVEDVGVRGESIFLSPCCSVGINRDFVESKRQAVVRIMNSYRRFIANLTDEDLEYGISIMSEATGYSRKVLVESLKSYEFKSEIDADLLSEYMVNVGIPISAQKLREMIFH